MLRERTVYRVLVMSTGGYLFDCLLASNLVDSGDLGIRVRGIRPRQDGMNSRLGRVHGLVKGDCRYSQINFHSPTTLDYMALSRASGPAIQSFWLFELFAWK